MAAGRIATCAAFVLASVLAPGTVGAAEPGEPKRLRGPLERAWRDATEMRNASLDENEGTQLVLLAYASAVDASCEGFELDEERYKAAFRTLAEERRAELGDQKKARSLLRRTSYHLGVATGLFLAEHAIDPERFCTGARESLEDPDIAAFFTPATATP
jgi:hypothetical protein